MTLVSPFLSFLTYVKRVGVLITERLTVVNPPNFPGIRKEWVYKGGRNGYIKVEGHLLSHGIKSKYMEFNNPEESLHERPMIIHRKSGVYLPS